MDELTPLVLFATKKYIFQTMLSMLFFLAIGALLLFWPWIERHLPPLPISPPSAPFVSAKFRIFLGILMLFFGIFSLSRFPRIVNRPILVIDETGIQRPHQFTIPWEEIIHIECEEDQTMAITLAPGAKSLSQTFYRLGLRESSPEQFQEACGIVDRYLSSRD